MVRQVPLEEKEVGHLSTDFHLPVDENSLGWDKASPHLHLQIAQLISLAFQKAVQRYQGPWQRCMELSTTTVLKSCGLAYSIVNSSQMSATDNNNKKFPGDNVQNDDICLVLVILLYISISFFLHVVLRL